MHVNTRGAPMRFPLAASPGKVPQLQGAPLDYHDSGKFSNLSLITSVCSPPVSTLSPVFVPSVSPTGDFVEQVNSSNVLTTTPSPTQTQNKPQTARPRTTKVMVISDVKGIRLDFNVNNQSMKTLRSGNTTKQSTTNNRTKNFQLRKTKNTFS
jgi:hypothetical protein